MGSDDTEGLDSLEQQLKGLLDGADLGESADSVVGETIADTYTLTKSLGEGGMGAVYLATHERTDGEVAIKLIKTSRLGNKTAVKRFELEAKHTASLNHPNIVRVFDYGQDGDLFYLAMEYVKGSSIQDLLEERGALDPELAKKIATQVLRALGEAHGSEQQIIHRDIKPANILVTDPDGEPFVKVLDFGIARALEGDAATTQGVIGSPQSMAPEQFEGGEISPATDMYALGCTMYGMLSGKPPFTGSISQLALKHVNQDPTPLSEATDRELPAELVAWVEWLMEKEPASRPQSADEALEGLQGKRAVATQVVGVEPAQKNAGLLAAAVVVLASIGAVGFFAMSPDGPNDTPNVSVQPETIGSPATLEPAELKQTSRTLPMSVILAPDGKRVLDVTSATMVEILSIDGAIGTARQIAVPAGTTLNDISWFDNHHLLATRVEKDGSFGLFKVTEDGEWTRLIDNAAWATASPDGQKIAFTRELDLTNGPDLFISNVDGSDLQSVTSGFRGLAFWLSDSSAVVLIQYQGKVGVQVAVANYDMSRTILSDRRLFVDGMRPAAAPLPGRRVVFALAEPTDAGMSKTTNLWSMTLDEEFNPSELARMTNTTGFMYANVQVAEKAGNILYCRGTFGSDPVVVKLTDGAWGVPEKVPGARGMDVLSDLSTDGSRILITSERSGRRQLYEQVVGEGGAKQLTHSELAAAHGRYLPGTGDILYWETDEKGDEIAGSQLMRRRADGAVTKVLSELRGGKQQRRPGMSYPTRVSVHCSPDVNPSCLILEVIEREFVFYSLDLEAGTTGELFRVPIEEGMAGSANHVAVRAAEPRIALPVVKQVNLYETGGKLAAEIPLPAEHPFAEHLAFAPEGTSVITNSFSKGQRVIMKLAADGTTTPIVPLGQAMTYGHRLSNSKDALGWTEVSWQCPVWEIEPP